MSEDLALFYVMHAFAPTWPGMGKRLAIRRCILEDISDRLSIGFVDHVSFLVAKQIQALYLLHLHRSTEKIISCFSAMLKISLLCSTILGFSCCRIFLPLRGKLLLYFLALSRLLELKMETHKTQTSNCTEHQPPPPQPIGEAVSSEKPLFLPPGEFISYHVPRRSLEEVSQETDGSTLPLVASPRSVERSSQGSARENGTQVTEFASAQATVKSSLPEVPLDEAMQKRIDAAVQNAVKEAVEQLAEAGMLHAGPPNSRSLTRSSFRKPLLPPITCP